MKKQNLPSKKETIALKKSPHSMTGFGRGQASSSTLQVEIEIKSTNHRFLDFMFRMPGIYSCFEVELRSLIGEKTHRGRIEIHVNRTEANTSGKKLEFNKALFESWHAMYKDVFKQQGINLLSKKNTESCLNERVIMEVLGRADIMKAPESQDADEEEHELLIQALNEALEALVSMRISEGNAIHAELVHRFQQVRSIRESISHLVSQSGEKIRERILLRVKKLSPDILLDEGRLAQEVAILVDRLDVAEELVRLLSHFEQFEKALDEPPCGKKLDFLLQEMNREFNTIASKAQEGGVQACVVNAKVEIERMREQVQNVE